VLDQKSDFIEKLTHDSYVVQIPRIQPRLQSRLEMLLTVFEQNHFTDEREITKNYTYQVNDEYIKDIVEILHHAGTDPDKRVEIEKEQEALRVYDLGMGELKKSIAEKEKTIAEKEKAIAEQERAIAENEKTISEKDKALAEKERLIEELKRRLGEK
jgi:uncharacterized coiled-coil protein SlyX